MPTSLIRGKYVIVRGATRDHQPEVVVDGAVFQDNGLIVDVGTYARLREQHPSVLVIGSSDDVVLPGFTNGHHHVGLTPLQLGSPDLALEAWFATRSQARDVDPYLDTLYSAFQMVESGVTTVQHLDGWHSASADAIFQRAKRVLQAYHDVGMRVSYSYGAHDQNHLVYEDDAAFVGRVPESLQPALSRWFASTTLSIEDQLGLFEELYRHYRDSDRIEIQLAPANLHWCSDKFLLRLQEHSRAFHVPMHMHVLETAYQKEYARRRTGTTAVRHLHELGMLGPHLTYGHGVWMTEDDIELTADTDTAVCHNASSNLRLRSGVLPVNILRRRGVRVGLGMDEAGINDDRDMLQEMRLVLRLHRTPGMDDAVPTSADVLGMATEYGASTTAYSSATGCLERGRAADVVLLSWNELAFPYLDEDVPVIDAVIQRAKSSAIRAVLVAGESIWERGRFTRVNKEEILEELAASLRVPKTAAEIERRELMRAVRPHVEQFYAGYVDPEAWQPFYRPSARF